MYRSLIVIAHNIRSAHNVGSLMRTCEGLGVERLYLTGYTPHPRTDDDNRLPHIVQRTAKQISKTALGAEELIQWTYQADIESVLINLKNKSYKIIALEQHKNSRLLDDLEYGNKIAILLGSEVTGIDQYLIEQTDFIVEIPMRGKKESFNVSSAAAMAIYHLTYLK